jgi:hypothetical protein
MKTSLTGRQPLAQVAAAVCMASLPMLAWSQASIPQWRVVANSSTTMPDSGGRLFSSFNQPSVTASGWVVMRARSKGGASSGEPVRGIYGRSMSVGTRSLVRLMDNQTPVPAPNNTLYNGVAATFTEFPAFARVSSTGTWAVTRAQSRPVWTYTLADGSETRVGSSGIYAHRAGERLTVMTQLGAVPGFEHFSVPGAAAGTRFDQFPGAPAAAGVNAVAFKGNYTEAGVAKTGVFFRRWQRDAPESPTQLIASSDRLIPGQAPGGVTFGSTAPPSASERHVVFLGVDNEASPTLGGIYRAPLVDRPNLETLVSIGSTVPGESAGTGFSRLGEALSFDGRYVAFWGAWGNTWQNVTLNCPVDGQAAVLASCLAQYPSGSTTVQVPRQQGVFVHDTRSRKTHAVMKTGGEWSDLLYWTFSGRPPGAGEAEDDDGEPPRWRASAFVAVQGRGDTAQVVFKARRPTTPAIDGVYQSAVPQRVPNIRVLIETGNSGQLLDLAAPLGAQITSLGVERDGWRGNWLALTASMLNPTTMETWAGVYAARIPSAGDDASDDD